MVIQRSIGAGVVHPRDDLHGSHAVASIRRVYVFARSTHNLVAWETVGGQQAGVGTTPTSDNV